MYAKLTLKGFLISGYKHCAFAVAVAVASLCALPFFGRCL